MLQSRAIKIFLPILAVLLLPGVLHAASVSLIWDENTEPELAGYRLYCGTASREYSEVIEVGLTPQYTVDGLEEEERYFFAVTAFNLEGDESDFSNEISYKPGEELEIVLITPNGGEEIVAGNDYTILWEVNPYFWWLKILLSTDAGATWTLVAGRTQNDGEYIWRVPEINSQECLLKLRSVRYLVLEPDAVGESGDFFSIAGGNLGTGNTGQGMIPRSVVLNQNFPNPFNPMTTIAFGVPQGENETVARTVSMKLYNTRGRLVRRLVECEMAPGYYSVAWDGIDEAGATSPSGIFFYLLSVDGQVRLSRKMVLAR